MEAIIQNFNKRYLLITTFLLFLGLSAWWIYINLFSTTVSLNDRQLFAASYQIIALFGAVVGLWIANFWGGFKSLLGKALFFFSLGLLFQSFGQSVYSYYIFFMKIEVPYPSLGDIGFFGSVISYMLGVLYLYKIVGVNFSFKKIKNQIYLILIPIVILFLSYFFFLKGYEFDWNNSLKVFLDFGYPLGQAIYVSFAIWVFISARKILDGFLKKPIMFLVFALFIQYFADFMFLYQANFGTWNVGGLNDYLYCFSYFIMSIALIHIGGVFLEIREKDLIK